MPSRCVASVDSHPDLAGLLDLCRTKSSRKRASSHTGAQAFMLWLFHKLHHTYEASADSRGVSGCEE